MKQIGTHEARVHWAELLRRVAQGEQFTITRLGVPVAVLSPPHRKDRDAGGHPAERKDDTR